MNSLAKKALYIVLALLLLTSFCFSAFAEAEPRWIDLSTFSVNLKRENGFLSNSRVTADASSWISSNTIYLTVTIQKWNGSDYADTAYTWSASGKGGVEINKSMSLAAGNYIAHCVATVYNSSGAYVETVTQDSNELII